MRAAAAASSAFCGALRVARGLAGWLRPGAAPPTPYEVLGLPPGADEPQIKAAYHTLARRYHPDVNAGAAASAERLAEVNRAYETLTDPEARAAYHRDLARHRTLAQRHYALLAATTAATFVVAAGVFLLALRWRIEAAPRAELPAAAARETLPQSRAPGAVAQGGTSDLGSPPQPAASWTTYRDMHFDFALRYPAGIFGFDAGQSDANVRTFVSRDGHATLRIVAAQNTAGITLASFRSTLIKERYAGASFDQAPRHRHWFVLSGTRGEEVFLERITFSCDGKSMHGWQMRYPTSERATYDELAQLVLRNAPHGNGPGCDDEKSKAKDTQKKKRG